MGMLTRLVTRHPKAARYILPIFIASLLVTIPAFASSVGDVGGGHAATIAQTFMWLAILFILSKIGSLVEKIGQPSVLGEIIIGVIIGNLGLMGYHWFDPVRVFFRNLEKLKQRKPKSYSVPQLSTTSWVY